MPTDLLDKVLDDVARERCTGGLVSPAFNGIWTAHYNEVLLYRHLEHLLASLRKHQLMTVILSNGVPLTPQRTDLLAKYPDVVTGICLNIPAFTAELWADRAGMSVRQFDTLCRNITYAVAILPHLVSRKLFTIQVNGMNANSLIRHGGGLEIGRNAPAGVNLDLDVGELAQQTRLAKELWPDLNVSPMSSLVDRAGTLAAHEVISNDELIDRRLRRDNTEVVGCNNGWEIGGRPFGWLHVNAAGAAFLCCNDYEFTHKFGDFTSQNLRDFWQSDAHVDGIAAAFAGLCRNCASARWGKGVA